MLFDTKKNKTKQKIEEEKKKKKERTQGTQKSLSNYLVI